MSIMNIIHKAGTLSTWLVNGIPAAALSVKCDILYKIGIANWFPSSHASSISAALGGALPSDAVDGSLLYSRGAWSLI
uniref:Uncharacterized protein n=1 Tax=Cucumis melo TaxID=3656 RepID=A0A9I9E6I6_CUCME